MSPELPAERRELARLTDEILEAKAEAGYHLWRVGEALRQIQSGELWRSGGYASFPDYLDRGAVVSKSFGYDLITVAKHFNLQTAQRYGVDKLGAVVKYVRATETKELPGDALAADIKVRAESGRFQTLPLHEATSSQIREATAILKAERAGRRRPPKVWAERVHQVADRLPGVKGVRKQQRVKATVSDQGEVMLSFRSIPAGEMLAFVTVLIDELVESGDRSALLAELERVIKDQ